jgi:hypothetical protein
MNKFLSYIQYNWYKYFLIIIVPLVFWFIIYSDIDQVKYDESIRILYIGDDLDEEKLRENISSNITSITNQELKYVSVMTYSAEGDVVYEYLRNKIYSVDIIIISNELLNEELLRQIFVPLTTNLKDKFLSADLLNINDNSYGLKIPSQSNFYQYCSTGKEATIFLSQYSLNIGKAYGYGDVQNDSAISIVKYILGEV